MSYVTNALVSFSIMEDADERMAEVNERLADAARGQQFGDIWRSDIYGGHKFMEVPLYGAAFNYVEVRSMMDALQAARWKEPEHVRLFICDQDDDTFSMLKLGEDPS